MAVPYHNYLLFMYEEREARKVERKVIRDVCDPFQLPDAEFQRLFRINKPMGLYLVEQLREDLEPLSEDGIPTHLKILSSVQFLANGGYQRQVGQDHSICVAQSTFSNLLSQFLEAIYRRLLSTWISFPATEAARQAVCRGFESRFGVPNVLGVLDCTHVKIFPPPGPEGAQYKNLRKGDHTINVQLVADSDCKIIHVNARYPGRVHDSFIWNHSNLKEEMKRLHTNRIGAYFLLGDSGYPLEPWLMTPVVDAHPDSPEARYTEWHCRARNTIERTNGYLKGSLRCLGIDRALHYSPEKASQIIYACCIIYNIMQHYGVPIEEEEEANGDNEVPAAVAQPAGGRLLQAARSRQAEIIRLFH